MTSLIYGSKLSGGIFSTPEMCALFNDEALVSRYIEIEAALAKVQGDLGIIPEEAADAIRKSADFANLDWEKLVERTRIVGVPVLPLIEQMSSWAPNGLGQYCHYGATTQDIMDTADILQMRAGLDLIEQDLDAICLDLKRLSEIHITTIMAGRTHLQHALPTSFGIKSAGWLEALDRHSQRISELRTRLEVISFGGAVGTLASLGDHGIAVRNGLAKALGLGTTCMSWHTARDAMAEATGLLALLGGTLGKIGTDIILMMQSETGEVLEPCEPGRGASSTMPQKRNPVGSEVMVTSARILREQHAIMLDAMIQDHERGAGPWQLEWHAMPCAFITASGAVKSASHVLSGLDLQTDIMAEGVWRTKGLIMAEAVMMGLAVDLGRQRAHDLVQDCCLRSLKEGMDFLEALCENPEISKSASRDRLASLITPENYLGSGPQMVRTLLKDREDRKNKEDREL